MKLKQIKEELRKMLLEMSMVKTDKAVLEYEGELKEGTDVYVVDAETNERTAAADGEYVTEDNKVITIEGGKVISIVEKTEEPVEEPAEEPVEPEEEKPVEAVEEEEKPVEEPAEEPAEKPAEEVKEEEPKEDETIKELQDKIAEMEAKIADMEALIEKIKAETEAKLEGMSAASPAAEEFEKTKTTKKTGNSKVDRFIERYGA